MSPAPDVWPSILTDYTYDSELDNADGVPHSVYDAARVPGGELKSTKFLLFICEKCIKMRS